MRYWKSKLAHIPKDFKVGIAVATYRQTDCLQALICSLKAQTFKNFVVEVVHDGLVRDDVSAAYKAVADHRFTLNEATHKGQFGHPHRHATWEYLAEPHGCTHLMATNGDNLYAPVFLEALLAAIVRYKADLAYSDCVHSHKLWAPMSTRLERGKIDLGCWVAKADGVLATPWEDFSFAGDWHYLARLLARRPYETAKVDGCLFVHN